MIALVDYGAGNLTSVRKALAVIGAEAWTPEGPSELERARGVIVPGVGHFDTTRGLTAEWRAAIRSAIDSGKPLLGICVGLQWLFEGSTEAPDVPGLGIFAGACRHLGESEGNPEPRLKVPHVGWNSLSIHRASSLMAGINSGTQVYFTHSYAAPVIDATSAICEYGVPFSAALERKLVAAVQFHPEKSGDAGLQILRNWLRAMF
ncbi:MAG: imidazole glycerol phosphate synthase subunit HisH [Vicinamibacterales bacterium]